VFISPIIDTIPQMDFGSVRDLDEPHEFVS
jgi:hypothetical protein